MYVQNDVSHDSRVLREATALAQAGHLVSIIGKGQGGDIVARGGDIASSRGATVQILRVSILAGSPYLRAPWRLVEEAAGDLIGAIRRGPSGLGRALLAVARIVVASGWSLVRLPWVAVVNRALRRPVDFHWLDRRRATNVELFGWRSAALTVAPAGDVHHAHDLEALPAAAAAAARDGGAVVYDKHEVFSGDRVLLATGGWLRRRVLRLERRLAGQADAIVTVNQPLADELRAALGLSATAVPVVVRNCPPRYDPPATGPDRLRAAAGLAPGTPVALYHGGFSRGRGLEQLAAAIREPGLEAVHAVYLGYGPLEPELRAWAADPGAGGRLHVLAAVPPDDLLDWIATADVAVMAIQPDTLNHRLSTPNKLFEAIAAGVPVVASDFPGLREVVADPAGPLGVLVDPTSPAAIGAGIREILDAPPPERARIRARCLAAAHERWNWETESIKLLELYGRLTGRPW
ncbi:MAG TPA: glycosyltransferase family 4 protein [Candidatus Limnocylindrales bacterium]|nr:glycosyltransferase family 4 protein [Candidatus Limnocylindrales bacterium]